MHLEADMCPQHDNLVLQAATPFGLFAPKPAQQQEEEEEEEVVVAARPASPFAGLFGGPKAAPVQEEEEEEEGENTHNHEPASDAPDHLS
jgi:hypothetical protein